MKTFKVFDKSMLTLANKIAIRRGYNRAIIEEHIAEQPNNAFWAVMLNIPHEHAAGKPVNMHMRCMIRQLFVENAPTLFVDTDLALFEELPTIEVKGEKENTDDTHKE